MSAQMQPTFFDIQLRATYARDQVMRMFERRDIGLDDAVDRIREIDAAEIREIAKAGRVASQATSSIHGLRAQTISTPCDESSQPTCDGQTNPPEEISQRSATTPT